MVAVQNYEKEYGCLHRLGPTGQAVLHFGLVQAPSVGLPKICESVLPYVVEARVRDAFDRRKPPECHPLEVL